MFFIFKNQKVKKIFGVAAIIAVFLSGYYLRGSLSLHHALAFSPYEAFKSSPFGGGDIFSDKLANYPLGFLAEKILNPLLGNFYLIYILGGLVIFFLGKKISQSNLGGILAFALFAVAPENLIQYTGRLYASGLCYVAIWLVLLFFLRYLENKKNLDLLIFVFFGIIAITSYHTGGAAFIVITFGLVLSHFFSQETVDKKILATFSILVIIYGFWLMVFDFSELELVRNSFLNLFFVDFKWQKIAIIASGLLIFFGLVLGRKKLRLDFEYLPLILLPLAAVLIFLPIDFFNHLLALGVSNYYLSNITLNNYLAQIILTHLYFLLLLKEIFGLGKKPKNRFLAGWTIGLVLVFSGLIMENYLGRILDYSSPLAFVLFGFYWSQKTKFRNIVVPLTVILLVASQLVIFHDPFSIRRYYDQAEIDSAKKIIALNLPCVMVSDLRIAGLFSYLGEKKVVIINMEKEEHRKLFYHPENVINYQFNERKAGCLILSQSMKRLVYSMNFETKPVDASLFAAYEKFFPKVFDDGQMMIYQIKKEDIIKK